MAVYVSAPLCADAKRKLERQGTRVAGVTVRTVCVDDASRQGSRLAAVGAAARRATEDSSSIAYIGTADPLAADFSEPILEAADIPRLPASSGEAAMKRLLNALRNADTSGSLREALRNELQ